VLLFVGVLSQVSSCVCFFKIHTHTNTHKADGAYTFVGDFEGVQALNDSDTLPPDILAANPQVWSLKNQLESTWRRNIVLQLDKNLCFNLNFVMTFFFLEGRETSKLKPRFLSLSLSLSL